MGNVITSSSLEITAPVSPEFAEILTPEALSFVARLEREFRASRKELLHNRTLRQQELNAGQKPDFLSGTRRIREDKTWKVAAIPKDLEKRHVEITGPTDRKMMINALNSGADVFMADFEDANSPTWSNLLEGHRNIRDAIDRTISFEAAGAKKYTLNDRTAVLVVRPRGWHLPEKHVLQDGTPISASLFDAGLFFYHNAHALLNTGSGPYFYLPKLENHLEARLWNDVFLMMQEELGIARGTIKVTVLLETILAAFEMEEILYELRDHITGLNAGRWDYIFSIIKKFHSDLSVLLPDRSQITMTVPFMRAYTELLVKTCHARGAHAMGGMAAFIPNRKDAEVTELALAKVREDKVREVADGFDGTWVAHPDLVTVAREPFARTLGHRSHQKERFREDVNVSSAELLNFQIAGGEITESGFRGNVSVALQYMEAWLRGSGAVGINNLMEDVATAEISRSQLWQWLHHPGAMLEDGRKPNTALYNKLADEELAKIKSAVTPDRFASGKFAEARELLNDLVTSEKFPDFLTLLAYNRL